MNANWKFRSAFLLVVMLGSAVIALANIGSQDGVWEKVDKARLRVPGIDAAGLPNAYEAFALNRSALEQVLDRAPEEFTDSLPTVLTLPMPDGTFSRFRI